MNEFFAQVESINKAIYDTVVANFGLWLLLVAGVLLTVGTKFFQVAHVGHWFKTTIGSVFKKDSTATKKTDKTSISQFQALCTALAATIGTGNVAGVATAIVIGGPGAVFWMWVAAFFGMMTKFSENVLGIYYRRRNKNGEWLGGAMYYLKDGLGSKRGCKVIGKVLAALFAVFCIIASFGIGNMGQVNSIVTNIKSVALPDPVQGQPDPALVWGEVFGIPVFPLVIGVIITIVAALIVLGGLQRIAAVAERIVPLMALMYIVGALAVALVHADQIGAAIGSVFRFAFGIEAVAGGAAGVALSTVITKGCARGVFSNEAGLGSSALVHTSANVKEPVKQGMWGIFEVFFDTIIVCTMTAIVVLTSGFIDLQTGYPAAASVNANTASTLVSQAFGQVFGIAGEVFVVIAITLFAFTTVLGWSQYGGKAAEYLFGIKGAKVYRVIFVLITVLGAVLTGSLAWDICDTFNGFMMIPNLIGVLVLLPLVAKITKNYSDRHFRNKAVKPILSYDKDIQAEMEQSL